MEHATGHRSFHHLLARKELGEVKKVYMTDTASIAWVLGESQVGQACTIPSRLAAARYKPLEHKHQLFARKGVQGEECRVRRWENCLRGNLG